MYFLLPSFFGIDGPVQNLIEKFRGLMLLLCTVVYKLIMYFYDIFIRLGTGEIITSSQVQLIYSRATLIIGLFMLFKMSISFIQYLLNPSMMEDKGKGASKLVLKAVVVVALLGTTPFIFESAYKFQGLILDSNVLGKVIIGNKNANANVKNFGPILASDLFLSFYSFAEGEEDNTYWEWQTAGQKFLCSELLGDDMDLLRDDIIYGRSFTRSYYCLNSEALFQNEFVIDFAGHGVIPLGVGIFILYIILSYCLSVGMRVVQLAFLQLIAPIPILSYLGEDKDGAFSKWVKRCVATFLDLFIRLVIIYFVVFLISNLLDNDSESWFLFLATTGNPTGFTKILIKVILILGLLMFAKKAPDLLKEVLPQGIGGQDYGFSLGKRFDNMLGGKIIKKAPAIVGSSLGRAGLKVANSVGIGLSNARRRKDLNLRQNFDSYKDSQDKIMNDLSNGKISEKQAKNKIRELRNMYSSRKGRQQLLANGSVSSDQISNFERLENANKNKNAMDALKTGGTALGRGALGAITGAYSGYKKGFSSTMNDTFSKNYDYAKFVASGADINDLIREYAAGLTGYDYFGTSAYYGNLKFDLERQRKRLKDTISGISSGLDLGNAMDSSSNDLETKSFNDGSVASGLVNLRNKSKSKISTLEGLIQNNQINEAMDFLVDSGDMVKLTGSDGSLKYVLKSDEGLFQNKLISKLDSEERRLGRSLTDVEQLNIQNSVVDEFAQKSDIATATTLLANQKTKAQNLDSAIKQAYKNGAVNKDILKQVSHTDYAISNSAVTRNKEKFVTSIVSRSDDLLSPSFLGLIYDDSGNVSQLKNKKGESVGVAAKLDFDSMFKYKSSLIESGDFDEVDIDNLFNITVKDSNKNLHTFTLNKNPKTNEVYCCDSSGKVYSNVDLMSEIINISGGYDNVGLLAENFANNGILQDAFTSWEKVAKEDYSSVDDKFAATLTNMDQNPYSSQADAAAAYVSRVKALKDLNMYTVPGRNNNVPPGGPPPGPGPSGPPPGPGPSGPLPGPGPSGPPSGSGAGGTP